MTTQESPGLEQIDGKRPGWWRGPLLYVVVGLSCAAVVYGADHWRRLPWAPVRYNESNTPSPPDGAFAVSTITEQGAATDDLRNRVILHKGWLQHEVFAIHGQAIVEVWWNNDRQLIIEYDRGTPLQGGVATTVIRRETEWQGVQIEYRAHTLWQSMSRAAP